MIERELKKYNKRRRKSVIKDCLMLCQVFWICPQHFFIHSGQVSYSPDAHLLTFYTRPIAGPQLRVAFGACLTHFRQWLSLLIGTILPPISYPIPPQLIRLEKYGTRFETPSNLPLSHFFSSIMTIACQQVIVGIYKYPR